MKTNKLMDEIRETMSPEMKKQMELSVRFTIAKINTVLSRRTSHASIFGKGY